MSNINPEKDNPVPKVGSNSHGSLFPPDMMDEEDKTDQNLLVGSDTPRKDSINNDPTVAATETVASIGAIPEITGGLKKSIAKENKSKEEPKTHGKNISFSLEDSEAVLTQSNHQDNNSDVEIEDYEERCRRAKKDMYEASDEQIGQNYHNDNNSDVEIEDYEERCRRANKDMNEVSDEQIGQNYHNDNNSDVEIDDYEERCRRANKDMYEASDEQIGQNYRNDNNSDVEIDDYEERCRRANKDMYEASDERMEYVSSNSEPSSLNNGSPSRKSKTDDMEEIKEREKRAKAFGRGKYTPEIAKSLRNNNHKMLAEPQSLEGTLGSTLRSTENTVDHKNEHFGTNDKDKRKIQGYVDNDRNMDTSSANNDTDEIEEIKEREKQARMVARGKCTSEMTKSLKKNDRMMQNEPELLPITSTRTSPSQEKKERKGGKGDSNKNADKNTEQMSRVEQVEKKNYYKAARAAAAASTIHASEPEMLPTETLKNKQMSSGSLKEFYQKAHAAEEFEAAYRSSTSDQVLAKRQGRAQRRARQQVQRQVEKVKQENGGESNNEIPTKSKRDEATRLKEEEQAALPVKSPREEMNAKVEYTAVEDDEEEKAEIEDYEERCRRNNTEMYDGDHGIEDIIPGAVAVAGISSGTGALDDIHWENGGPSSHIVNDDPSLSTADNISYFSYADSNTQTTGSRNRIDDNLIKATIVEDDIIPEAEAVSETTLNKRRRVLLFGGCILALIFIVMAAVLGSRFNSGTPSSTGTVSPMPSLVPSVSPSSSPTSTLQNFLEMFSPDLGEVFEDQNSLQSKALKWLETSSAETLSLPDHRIVQRFVLAALYYSMDGDKWLDSTGWMSEENECTWFEEIKCDGEDSAVTELRLTSNRLKGTIGPELYLLSKLRVLDLSENLIGGSLPSQIGLMTSLTKISLKANALEGTLTSELGLMSNSLLDLDLSSNNIEGSIPTSLGAVTRLSNLKLNDNALSGEIPTEVGLLSKLTSLYLSENTLSGSIPGEILQLKDLEYFVLGKNAISGSLPSFGNQSQTGRFFPSLKQLSMEYNSINGTIPHVFGQMENLESMDISYNLLSGMLPTAIGGLTKLQNLNLARNFITGKLPAQIRSLRTLKSMELRKNGISGTIPRELKLLVRLETLNLRTNGLQGSVPSSLGEIKTLESLVLSWNRLSGTLPPELMSATNLRQIDVTGNLNLKGIIPTSIGQLTSLEALRLGLTMLTGSVPQEICDLRQTSGLDDFQAASCEINCDCCYDRCGLVPNVTTNGITCPLGLVSLQIVVGTDRDPEGVQWDVIDDLSLETLLKDGPYTTSDRNRKIVKEKCVSVSECATFTLLDANNDGISMPAALAESDVGDQFAVYYGGEEVSLGVAFNSINKPIRFGENCTEQYEPTPSPTELSGYIEGRCYLCQDGSEPPNSDVLLPSFRYSTVGGITCGDVNAILVGMVNIEETEPGRCASEQSTIGAVCGCKNDVAEEDVCPICSGGQLSDPFKVALAFGASLLTCMDMEVYGNTVYPCELNAERFSKVCCPTKCTTSEECDDGYSCSEQGHCEYCNNPDTVNSDDGCLTFGWLEDSPEVCPFTYCPDRCGEGFAPISVILGLDFYPDEVSWTLTDYATGEMVSEGGDYIDTWAPQIHDVCVPLNSCLIFTITDPNGICCTLGSGFYKLFMNGEEVAKGGEFSGSETVYVGNCPPSVTPLVPDDDSSSVDCEATCAPVAQCFMDACPLRDMETLEWTGAAAPCNDVAAGCDECFPDSPCASLTDPVTTTPPDIDCEATCTPVSQCFTDACPLRDMETLEWTGAAAPCNDVAVGCDKCFPDSPCASLTDQPVSCASTENDTSSVPLAVEISLLDDPSRTSWSVTVYDENDKGWSDGTIVLSGGPYSASDVGSVVVESSCVKLNSCIAIELKEPREDTDKEYITNDFSSMLSMVELYVNGTMVGVGGYWGSPAMLWTGSC